MSSGCGAFVPLSNTVAPSASRRGVLTSRTRSCIGSYDVGSSTTTIAPENPGLLLSHFVGVRMIDERAGARRREARLERVARRDGRRDPAGTATEPSDAVEVALELNAVPVDGRCFRQLVHHGDAHRLAALEHDRWAGEQRRSRRRRRSAVLQHVAVCRLGVGTAGVDARDEPEPASTVIVRRRHRGPVGAHFDSHHQPAHHLERMIVHVHPLLGRQRRAVERAVAQDVVVVVAVEQPVACSFRHPGERDRAAWRDPFRDDEMGGAGGVRRVAALAATRVHVEVEAVQVHRMRHHGRVHDAEPHRVTHGVGEAFGVRPRLAVDHEPVHVGARDEARVVPGGPESEHEHAVSRRA